MSVDLRPATGPRTAMSAWAVGPAPGTRARIRAVTRPVPVPGTGEVLVRLGACGVCRTDLHVADGDLAPHLPEVIPGHEGVGEVVGLGSGTSRSGLGDRVGIAWLRHTCGECRWCRTGAESLCPDSAYTGWDADGCYATYAVVPAAFAYRVPPCCPTASPRRCCARGSSATGR